jgi:uncharacterized protein (DUF58 family)
MNRLAIVLLILLVTLFYALATGSAMYYRILYIVGFALISSYFWGRSNIRGIRVEAQRRTSRVQAGDTVETQITVWNDGLLPTIGLQVRELTDMPGEGIGKIVSLGWSSSRSWRNHIPAKKRGFYTIGPLEVNSSDPFGLFHYHQTFPDTHEVVVYPTTVELPYLNLSAAGLPEDGPRLRPSGNPTPHAFGVRQYLPSDSFSRIHWPTTIRTGTLMVKQFDQGVANDLWLLVDLDHDVQEGIGYDTTDEHSITVAASVAQRYLNFRVPVGLVAHGQKPIRISPDQNSAQMGRLMEALTGAQALGELPLTNLLIQVGRLFEKTGTLMIITPSPNTSWVNALTPLLQRGTRVVVVIIDPASFGGSADISEVVGQLVTLSIPTYLVRRDETLATALALPTSSPVPAPSNQTPLRTGGDA